jgi:hypothetical protein
VFASVEIHFELCSEHYSDHYSDRHFRRNDHSAVIITALFSLVVNCWQSNEGDRDGKQEKLA